MGFFGWLASTANRTIRETGQILSGEESIGGGLYDFFVPSAEQTRANAGQPSESGAAESAPPNAIDADILSAEMQTTQNLGLAVQNSPVHAGLMYLQTAGRNVIGALRGVNWQAVLVVIAVIAAAYLSLVYVVPFLR